MIRILLVTQLLLGLAACGKEDAPDPPGPADQVTFPKVYPTH